MTLDTRRNTFEELAEDYVARLRRGEHPTLSEYTSQNPDFADEIRDIFPALLMMEEARPRHDPGLGKVHVTADGRPLERLKDYRIIREIGHGGMGIVYEAEQEALGRRVALKVLPIPTSTDSKALLRFRREARSAGRLHHTNIVPVFDVGHCDGVHYYAMQFILGQSLDEVIAEVLRLRGKEHSPRESAGVSSTVGSRSSDLTPESDFLYYRNVARIGLQVATALEYAHSQNVLHRDIKPSNLLLDARGTVWVTDFGLAKEDGDDLTRSGDIVGTLRYMAPERFDGVSTARSDIYSLGLTLYELLALRPAFDETDRARFMRDVAQVDPPAPHVHDPHVPRDLETIVMTAIAKDPHQRYFAAEDLVEDLRRFLADRPIQARRSGWHERAWRMCRRNPALAGLMTALAVTLVVGFAAVFWKWRDAEQARNDERAARTREHAALQLAEKHAAEVRGGLDQLKAANALLDKGRVYEARFQWDDAHAAFTQAIALRPDHVAARVERSDLYTQLGLWDLAANDYAEEMKLRETDATSRWYHHALLRLYVGDVDGYRQACQRMRHRFRGTLHARFAEEVIRSHLLTTNHDADLPQMLETLQHLTVEHPLTSVYVLGTAHYRAGQDDEAIRRLNESLSAQNPRPISSLSYSVLAMAHHRQGQTAEAQRVLNEMGRLLDTWTRERCKHQAEWVVHQGASGVWPLPWWDYLEGQLLFREAKRLIEGVEPPDDPRLHLLRARAFAGLRRSNEAAREYDLALELNPRDEQIRLEAHRTRGYIFVHRHQWSDAATEFAKARELRPDDSYTWRFLAIVYFVAGDLDAYRQTCSAMLSRFEQTQDSVTAANVLLACALRDDALPDMNRLLPLTQVAESLWHWGTWLRGAALCRAGQNEEAVQCFEAAAKVYQQRAWDWCFLGIAHARLGHFEAAQRSLTEARQWIADANQSLYDDLSDTRPTWGDWHEAIVASHLLREAENLLLD